MRCGFPVYLYYEGDVTYDGTPTGMKIFGIACIGCETSTGGLCEVVSL